jgi:16S rRNA (uracil1498-N3)-methyltransferase
MAPSIRLFVRAPLHAGVRIEAARAQAHYVGTVMRREPGDPVVLFNGEDGEWLAHLTTLRRDSAGIVAERMLRPQAPEPDLWLLFAPLKRDATELVVQKATELGVAVAKPVLTGRSNTARLNLDRLSTIAIEAAEQSERLTIPRIDPPRRLDEVLADWSEARPLVLAAARSTAPPVPAIKGPVALLVGPEGGFTPAELDALRQHPFVQPATLGPRILRAETAAIVGLALLQARSGG